MSNKSNKSKQISFNSVNNVNNASDYVTDDEGEGEGDKTITNSYNEVPIPPLRPVKDDQYIKNRKRFAFVAISFLAMFVISYVAWLQYEIKEQVDVHPVNPLPTVCRFTFPFSSMFLFIGI